MLEGISEKLKQGINKISRAGIVDKEHVEELVKDMQRTLLSGDVDVNLVFTLSNKIKERSMEKLPEGLTRKEHVIKVVYEELVEILGGEKSEPSIKSKKILLAGLYGTGKTSTAAKLARFYQKKGLKVGLVCCDVVRPAAYEQLEQLSMKINAPFYGEKENKNPSEIAKRSLEFLKTDVIIFDSSGRNALENELIEEIKSLRDVVNPDEKILVIPADIGQAAKEQAETFHEALDITNVIITKMDATAKGGGALTACKITGSKVLFITTGENVDSLELYDPKRFVGRLIGFPDLETLMEKAHENLDVEKTEKMFSGDFTLEDFQSQYESVSKMGSMDQIMDMMGLGKMKTKIPDMDIQQNKMKKWRFIIDSMTKYEKQNPEEINASRITRISKGSGVMESDVRELLSNFKKTKKMIKGTNAKKLKRSGLGNLLGKFGL